MPFCIQMHNGITVTPFTEFISPKCSKDREGRFRLVKYCIDTHTPEQAMGHCLWPMTQWPTSKLTHNPIIHDPWPIGVKTTKFILVTILLLRTLLTQYLTHQLMQHSNVDSSAKHAVCSYILLFIFRRDSLTSLNNFWKHHVRNSCQ